MPSWIVKPSPDHDLYVEWSSVVDNAVAIGTREEMIVGGVAVERLDRAGRTGTSCKGFEREGDGFQPGGWDDKGFILTNMETRQGFRWLPRANLLRFVQAMYVGDTDTAESDEITEPCDDD